jgi:hypothetical protein
VSTSECIKLVPLLKLDSISSCSLITLKFRTIAVGSIVIRFYTVMRGCWKREAWLGLIESFLRLSIIEYFNFTIEDLQKELNSKHLSFSQIILNSKVSTCFCYRFACLYQGATALADHSRPSTFRFVDAFHRQHTQLQFYSNLNFPRLPSYNTFSCTSFHLLSSACTSLTLTATYYHFLVLSEISPTTACSEPDTVSF